MSCALDEVAAAADEVADDQRRVARRARAMQRQRDRGWSWGRILDREAGPGLLELLRRSRRRLIEATGQFARTVAAGLSEEGESSRQVGRRLGVTHQRVLVMLKGHRRPSGDQDMRTDR
jgi:peptidoglycan/xylan/chitin deacetylase (PgdA/CDA1 family)